MWKNHSMKRKQPKMYRKHGLDLDLPGRRGKNVVMELTDSDSDGVLADIRVNDSHRGKKEVDQPIIGADGRHSNSIPAILELKRLKLSEEHYERMKLSPFYALNHVNQMSRINDVNDYVVHDPLLEKGKEKFNKMQAKEKRKQREWAEIIGN